MQHETASSNASVTSNTNMSAINTHYTPNTHNLHEHLFQPAFLSSLAVLTGSGPLQCDPVPLPQLSKGEIVTWPEPDSPRENTEQLSPIVPSRSIHALKDEKSSYQLLDLPPVAVAPSHKAPSSIPISFLTPPAVSTLFLANLPNNITESQLMSYIAHVDSHASSHVTRISLPHHPNGSCLGYAYVQFTSAPHAAVVYDVLHTVKAPSLKSRQILAEYAQSLPKSFEDPSSSTNVPPSSSCSSCAPASSSSSSSFCCASASANKDDDDRKEAPTSHKRKHADNQAQEHAVEHNKKACRIDASTISSPPPLAPPSPPSHTSNPLSFEAIASSLAALIQQHAALLNTFHKYCNLHSPTTSPSPSSSSPPPPSPSSPHHMLSHRVLLLQHEAWTCHASLKKLRSISSALYKLLATITQGSNQQIFNMFNVPITQVFSKFTFPLFTLVKTLFSYLYTHHYTVLATLVKYERLKTPLQPQATHTVAETTTTNNNNNHVNTQQPASQLNYHITSNSDSIWTHNDESFMSASLTSKTHLSRVVKKCIAGIVQRFFVNEALEKVIGSEIVNEMMQLYHKYEYILYRAECEWESVELHDEHHDATMDAAWLPALENVTATQASIHPTFMIAPQLQNIFQHDIQALMSNLLSSNVDDWRIIQRTSLKDCACAVPLHMQQIQSPAIRNRLLLFREIGAVIQYLFPPTIGEFSCAAPGRSEQFQPCAIVHLYGSFMAGLSRCISDVDAQIIFKMPSPFCTNFHRTQLTIVGNYFSTHHPGDYQVDNSRIIARTPVLTLHKSVSASTMSALSNRCNVCASCKRQPSQSNLDAAHEADTADQPSFDSPTCLISTQSSSSSASLSSSASSSSDQPDHITIDIIVNHESEYIDQEWYAQFKSAIEEIGANAYPAPNTLKSLYLFHYFYSFDDVRPLQLLCVILHWSEQRSIHGASNKYLSSFSWMLLLIYALQHKPSPVLPILPFTPQVVLYNVYEQPPKHHYFQWRTKNNFSIIQLLHHFFKFYATLNVSTTLIHIAASPASTSMLPPFSTLTIQDPLVHNDNPARALHNDVTSWRHIVKEMKRAIWLIQDHMHCISSASSLTTSTPTTGVSSTTSSCTCTCEPASKHDESCTASGAPSSPSLFQRITHRPQHSQTTQLLKDNDWRNQLHTAFM